jgi:hypothetical protein
VDTRLARELLTLRPTLSEHACKQDGIGRFGDKIVGSTLPHLIEHLAIDLLVEQALADTSMGHSAENPNGVATQRIAPVFGNTKWLDKDAGTMQVTISSTTQDAELVARALTYAVELVNHLSDRQATK